MESESPQQLKLHGMHGSREAWKANEQGEFSMDKDYKAHDIHATASYVPGGWKPHLYIVYSEGGRNIIKNFTIDQTFSTREEAEQAGLSFAQKWIDDGKPNLTP